MAGHHASVPLRRPKLRTRSPHDESPTGARDRTNAARIEKKTLRARPLELKSHVEKIQAVHGSAPVTFIMTRALRQSARIATYILTDQEIEPKDLDREVSPKCRRDSMRSEGPIAAMSRHPTSHQTLSAERRANSWIGFAV